MKDTELIIFDLGRVLVDFDFKKVIRDLKKFTHLSEAEIHDYFTSTPLWDAFERGRVNPAAFFDKLQQDLHLKKLSFEVFAPVWNGIFTEMPESVAILGEVRGRYRTAMLSNVNIMHWEYIAERHAFTGWFDHPVTSYAVGYRKPDIEIFQLVLDRAKVPAQRAVFIDDLESHVLAAKSIGIRAYQFTSAKQLRQDLADLL